MDVFPLPTPCTGETKSHEQIKKKITLRKRVKFKRCVWSDKMKEKPDFSWWNQSRTPKKIFILFIMSYKVICQLHIFSKFKTFECASFNSTTVKQGTTPFAAFVKIYCGTAGTNFRMVSFSVRNDDCFKHAFSHNHLHLFKHYLLLSSYKKQLLTHPFCINRILLSLFTYELLTFEVVRDFSWTLSIIIDFTQSGTNIWR